jgi:hypothetical protein
MRSSVVSFTCAAGALVLLLSCAARAKAEESECCADYEEFKSAAPNTGVAGAGGDARAEAASLPVPGLLRPSGLADAASYSDAFRVLSYESPCSRFYGGPRLALTILNGLVMRLRSRPLGASGVGIMMSGGYDIYRDGTTGVTYRLFKEAFINSDGPFLMRVPKPQSARLRVGRFEAETRQARVLLLLHEMGHLVGAPDGGWLLPNDGGDPAQSERNTRTVESQCLKQLLALDA